MIPGMFPPNSVRDESERIQESDQAAHEPSDLEKQNSAWLYYGYRALSKWMASDHEFFVLRRYSAMNARCLLFLQNEIAKKEKRLAFLDGESMRAPPGLSGCDSFDDDPFPERNTIILEVATLLQQYCQSLHSFQSRQRKLN